jgi:hypothetical protein
MGQRSKSLVFDCLETRVEEVVLQDTGVFKAVSFQLAEGLLLTQYPMQIAAIAMAWLEVV